MSWQLQEAKNKLSEVVKAAKTRGPQIITVRGKEEVAVISISELRRMQAKKEPLGTFLWRTAPRGIDPSIFERLDDTGRDVEL